MGMDRRSAWGVAVCALVLLAAELGPLRAAAAAERDPRETEARKRCLAGDVKTGVSLLAELYVEERNPTYIYNQARCYQQNGRTDEAIDHFREYLRIAHQVTDEDRQKVEGYIRELESSRSARATQPVAPPVIVPPAPPPTPVGLYSPPPPPPPEPAPTLVASEPVELAPSWRRPTAFALGLGALASLGTGVVFHVIRESRAQDYNYDCFPVHGAGCDDRESSVNTAGALAVTGYVAAALLGGTSAVLFLNESQRVADARRPGSHALCVWWPMPAGLSCATRF